MTPARLAEIRARDVAGEFFAGAHDLPDDVGAVIRELLAALEEAESALAPTTGPGCRGCALFNPTGGYGGGWSCGGDGRGHDWIDEVTGADGGALPDGRDCPIPTVAGCPEWTPIFPTRDPRDDGTGF